MDAVVPDVIRDEVVVLFFDRRKRDLAMENSVNLSTVSTDLAGRRPGRALRYRLNLETRYVSCPGLEPG